MKSVIIDDGFKFFTYLLPIFSAIENAQNQYNWLITNCECYPQNPEFDKLLSKEYCWITGTDLSDMVEQENFQWVWAVLSGFTKDVSLDQVLQHKLPYADENPEFWKDSVLIQHPLASIEIVAWDSSLTLFLSKENTLAEKVMQAFPLSYDLQENNIRTNAQVKRINELIEYSNNERLKKCLHDSPNFAWSIWRGVFKRKLTTPSDQEILCEAEKLSKGN